MAKEYIDREALLRRLNADRNAIKAVTDDRFYTSGFEDALYTVENFPTADVVEVKHGEWIDCNEYDGNLKCSLCEEHYPWGVAAFYRYCPNCGAKMDGERKEQE